MEISGIGTFLDRDDLPYPKIKKKKFFCLLNGRKRMTHYCYYFRQIYIYIYANFIHPVAFPLQVLEDSTGVRRVVVTPQSPECYPASYPSAISPTHHLPPYLTHHPHFIHNSHTAFYPPVTGPGDIPPQFFPQHHLPPTIYGEQGKLNSTPFKSRLRILPRCLDLLKQDGHKLSSTYNHTWDRYFSLV